MKLLQFFGKLKKSKLFVIRRVAGDSMIPTLNQGDLVIGTRPFKRLSVGTVVIIRHNGLEKIKRIAKIDSDQLFVVGDNQTHSTDSRSFGWLPISTVVARIIWPRRLP